METLAAIATNSDNPLTTYTGTSRPPIFDEAFGDESEKPNGNEVSIFGIIAVGINADFSQPVPCCDKCGSPICKDIEIMDALRRVPIICECRKEALRADDARMEAQALQRKLDKYRVYSLMDNHFSESTFENWVFRGDNRDLYDLGKRYCDNWEAMRENNRGLLVHGEAGNGKTFFSFAIANELYRRGKAVLAISVSRILEVIKDGFNNRGEVGELAILNTLSDASLLILDDLGVESKTSWSYEKLYNIIDARYRARKPTIITTNLRIDEAEGINELRDNLSIVDARIGRIDQSNRIYNRIVEMCALIKVSGASWRIQKGEANKAALFSELGL